MGKAPTKEGDLGVSDREEIWGDRKRSPYTGQPGKNKKRRNNGASERKWKHPQKGPPSSSKKDPQSFPHGDGDDAKRTPSIVGLNVCLPASPSSILDRMVGGGCRLGAVASNHLLYAISHLVDLAMDSGGKRLRSRLNPSLRDNRKSFEITKDEMRCYINRVSVAASAGPKTTTLMKLLEDLGYVRKLKGGSNIPPCRGTTYAFTCKRFVKCELELKRSYVEKCERKLQNLKAKRDTHPLVEIFRSNVRSYSLSDADLELLALHTSYDEDGVDDEAGEDGTKYYFDQYVALKNWDGDTVKAKRGSYYSVYSTIPGCFRVRRRDKDGVHLALVDVSSAFCVFLYKLFQGEIEWEKDRGDFVEKDLRELRAFGDDIEHRSVYEKFGKTGFLSLMNASEEIGHIGETAEKFAAEYPLLARRLRRMKKRNKQKLYHLLLKEQTKVMEKATLQCRERGFDAMILGDELDVPEHEAYRVKDLLLALLHEETGLSASVKISFKSADGVRSERFKFADNNPVMMPIYPAAPIDEAIVERAAELFVIVRISAKRDGQRFWVSEDKAIAAAHLFSNVVSNRLGTDACPRIVCDEKHAA